jgi:hypothetical protein
MQARSVDRSLGSALHSEFGQQGRDIVLDRLLRQEQPLPDLSVGASLSDQIQDPPRQITGRLFGAMP